ncbi:Hypothetical protein NTJ_05111 [Nesidiocoris tenuis]|uniref:Uncharacterized protein n=1 Tax=Nesidiocoris tenuis TaxID=355587 RepID=A0ABN7AK17_9HEMI|nr:Hypothetical protein NTJ_05111 [Nesidiocoris tenuis]
MRAPCVRVVRAALLRKYAPVLFAVRLRRSRSAEDKEEMTSESATPKPGLALQPPHSPSSFLASQGRLGLQNRDFIAKSSGCRSPSPPTLLRSRGVLCSRFLFFTITTEPEKTASDRVLLILGLLHIKGSI